MNRTEIERLAHAVHALRPDWPWNSLVTFISVDLTSHPYRDAAVALSWVACEPETRTPKRVLEPGPWWKAATVGQPEPDRVTPAGRCPYHPTQTTPCAACAAYARTALTNPDRIREIRNRYREGDNR